MNLNRNVTKSDKLMVIILMLIFYLGVTTGLYILPTYPVLGAVLLGLGGVILLGWGLFSLTYLNNHNE